MKTTIVLDEALLKSAKQHAIATQQTLTELVQDALIGLMEAGFETAPAELFP